MSNVLPPQEQKNVWVFYRTRFVLVGAMALTALAIIALVALIPAYISLEHNRPIIDQDRKKSADVRLAERTEAFKVQALMAQLQPLSVATTSPMEYILPAFNDAPSGIVVQHISYRSDPLQYTIVIGGSTASRESINTYRKSLEARVVYTSVSVPVNDLVGASGNSFTVTLTKKFK